MAHAAHLRHLFPAVKTADDGWTVLGVSLDMRVYNSTFPTPTSIRVMACFAALIIMVSHAFIMRTQFTPSATSVFDSHTSLSQGLYRVLLLATAGSTL